MYRHFLLNSGYAEEEALASVLLSKEDGAFETVEQAVQTLVDGLAAEKGFDTTNPDEVYDAIVEFLSGDMQTHGYFLFNYEWNTNNMTDDVAPDELVVCISRAPEVISGIYSKTISQEYFECMTNCIKIKAVHDNHLPRLR